MSSEEDYRHDIVASVIAYGDSPTKNIPNDPETWKVALNNGLNPNTQWVEKDLVGPLEYNSCVIPAICGGGCWAHWNTPLHLALWTGDLKSARILLSRGADINLYNAARNTALFEAVIHQRKDTVSFLISQGANLNIPTAESTVEYWSRPKTREKRTSPAGRYPLQAAIGSGDVPIIRALVEGGADVNYTSPEGWTPFDLALLDKQRATIDLLSLHGARLSVATLIEPQGFDSMEVCRSAARGLYCSTASGDVVPPVEYRHIYRHILSNSDFHRAYNDSNGKVAATTARLIDIFFSTLTKLADLHDFQPANELFCARCIDFQESAIPTYHDGKSYDTAPFELHSSRRDLNFSAQNGCPLCSVIADVVDYREEERRREAKEITQRHRKRLKRSHNKSKNRSSRIHNLLPSSNFGSGLPEKVINSFGADYDPADELKDDDWETTDSDADSFEEDSHVPGSSGNPQSRKPIAVKPLFSNPGDHYGLEISFVGEEVDTLGLRYFDDIMALGAFHYDKNPTHTGSPGGFKTAKFWLEQCRFSPAHSLCQTTYDGSEPSLPSRVIDVGSEATDPFLLVSEGSKAPYCALSYCWGSLEPTFRTTKENLSKRLSSISMNSLPATLRDAIVAARNLKFQYIWIDALCIVQNDRDDWEREAAKMQSVYTGATLTISTTDSKSATDGLFRPRRARVSTPVRLNIRIPKRYREFGLKTACSLAVLPHTPPNLRSPMHGHVHTRAWTLQEEMLSTRMLFYGNGTLHWECLCHCALDTNPRGETYLSIGKGEQKRAVKGVLPLTREITSTRRGSFKNWQDLVEQYTSRDITQVSDRLPAFLGISKFMERSLCDEFIGGIWKGKYFLESLCWNVCLPGTTNPNYPSWTWASVTGRTNYSFLDTINRGRMTTLASLFHFDATCNKIQSKVTGSILLTGTLGRLDGPFDSSWIEPPTSRYTDTKSNDLHRYSQDRQDELIGRCWYLDILEFESKGPPKAGTPAYWFGRPRSTVRLLLQPIEDEPTTNGLRTPCKVWKPKKFRRIGVGMGNDEGCLDIRYKEIVRLV